MLDVYQNGLVTHITKARITDTLAVGFVYATCTIRITRGVSMPLDILRGLRGRGRAPYYWPDQSS